MAEVKDKLTSILNLLNVIRSREAEFKACRGPNAEDYLIARGAFEFAMERLGCKYDVVAEVINQLIKERDDAREQIRILHKALRRQENALVIIRNNQVDRVDRVARVGVDDLDKGIDLIRQALKQTENEDVQG